MEEEEEKEWNKKEWKEMRKKKGPTTVLGVAG